MTNPLLYSVSLTHGASIFDPPVGAGSIRFSNGTILGRGACIATLHTVTEIGVYPNTTSPVISASGLVCLPSIWR